jgi:hypothetical protein
MNAIQIIVMKSYSYLTIINLIENKQCMFTNEQK